jgi:hypothetical protein
MWRFSLSNRRFGGNRERGDVILRLAEPSRSGFRKCRFVPARAPVDETGAIPNLKAVERAFALSGLRVSMRNRVFVRETGRQNLDALNPPVA